jgi:hypothetical protein
VQDTSDEAEDGVLLLFGELQNIERVLQQRKSDGGEERERE